MRLPAVLIAALAVLLAACGSQPTQPATTENPKQVEPAKPADESARFPKANLVETKVVGKEIMAKPFMPGGTIARYKNGKTEYEMFVAKLPSATDAAILLPDWNKALTGSKLVPSFGGYFGDDGGRPVFVFAKGAWIAGIAGLPEKQADAQARILAAELQ